MSGWLRFWLYCSTKIDDRLLGYLLHNLTAVCRAIRPDHHRNTCERGFGITNVQTLWF